MEQAKRKKQTAEAKLEVNQGFTDMENVEANSDSKAEKNGPKLLVDDVDENEEIIPSVSWKEALCRREFYLLWVTRLSVVLITQVVAAMYKAFGQTFIFDDQFLAMVGSMASCEALFFS